MPNGLVEVRAKKIWAHFQQAAESELCLLSVLVVDELFLY
jgi:hypothetical protein